VFTFASFVVVGHLKASSSESALDVKALVGVAAVEDALVAANLLGDVVEGLDQAEAELLALLILGDGDVFDVADLAQAVDAVERPMLDAGCLGCEEPENLRGWETPSGSGAVGYTQLPEESFAVPTYNLCSTIRAPVATTEFFSRAVSSMTMM
jgi:hypothetical protein